MTPTTKHPANLVALHRRLAAATLAIALAGGGAAFAVEPRGDMPQRPDGPPPVEQMLQHLQQELGLSDAQAAQVKQILQQERAKHDAIRQEAQQALQQVLTPEQLQKMESRRQNGPRGPGGPGGHGGQDGRGARTGSAGGGDH